MNQASDQVEQLIRRAREGDSEALGELLDKHRAYLRAMARRRIDGKLAVRVDASDLIQQTCLSVHKNFDKFAGEGEAEFVAWLGKVHEQNILNAVRDHAGAQKRAIGREQRPPETGSSAGEFQYAANQARPSQHAVRKEQVNELMQMLDKLPQDQREAVRLRHLEGRSLEQIAQQMGRSQAATVGLIKRGMQKLREHFKIER